MRITVVLLFFISNAAFGNIDPLADGEVSCDEMENYPKQVFDLDDLGSGYGSPYEVDYQCPKSLSQVDFLQGVLAKSESIRAPASLPQICTGSIVHAHWRYYHFDLAKLGYYPQGYSDAEQKNKGFEYFKEWSYYSLANRAVYLAYMAELDKVRSQLTKWYIKNHGVKTEQAEKYADLALSRISSHGFGSYPYDWQPEELVAHTNEAITGEHQGFFISLSQSSDMQKLNSLRRLLIHNSPSIVIETLLSSISSPVSSERAESPISNAINNPAHVKKLLDAGFDPNQQNEFGKTPLYYAIQFNQHGSVRTLLEAGAKVKHRYQLEVDDEWNCIGITQWGRTPLMHAAQHSDIEMLKLLLKYKASLLTKDELGSTALDYAIKNDQLENANFLRSVSEKSQQNNTNSHKGVLNTLLNFFLN